MITSLVITLLAWKTNKVKVESEWRAHRPLQVMGGALPQHYHRYHLFFVFVIDCFHTFIKTLPKAQRTRELSSSCQSNFLRSYDKFKHKS